jgi:GNAT superfamily N-acetyltransferase
MPVLLRACGDCFADAKRLLLCYNSANLLCEPRRHLPGSLDTFRDLLQTSNVLLAEAELEPLGWVSYKIERPYCMITGLYVKLPRQREGIGHALVNAAQEAAQAQGCTLFLLKTLKNASWAKAFYLREGFSVQEAGGVAPQEWEAAKRAFLITECVHSELFCKRLVARSAL